MGTAEFNDVTLYFWGNANKTISKGKQVLTSEQIQKAKTSDGALVGMPEGATHVSMTANNILGGNMQDSPVTGFQSLGDGFLSKVPMSSPAAVPTPHSTIANAKQVNLVPVPVPVLYQKQTMYMLLSIHTNLFSRLPELDLLDQWDFHHHLYRMHCSRQPNRVYISYLL